VTAEPRGSGPGVITPDGCAEIQALGLGRRYDAVLLASFMVNVPDDRLRQGFLRACRRHVHAGGCVLLQRHEPAWFDEAAEGRSPVGRSPSACATSGGPVRACCRRRPRTRSATGSGPSGSPPGGWTTSTWSPPWPPRGWPSTPT
jgi:hypothetical protein